MDLKVSILNINGLTRRKEPEIECIIQTEQPHIFFIVETHRHNNLTIIAMVMQS